MARREYYTLMASLPALPYFERADRLPINLVRLKERMKMLEPEDQEITKKLVEFIAWQQQPLERTDAEVVELYNGIKKLTAHHPVIWKMVEAEMNQRTILAALRLRSRGMGGAPAAPPPRDRRWGVGSWLEHIIRNWNHPDFRMGMIFPWLPKARALLENGEALELERLIMRNNWRGADALFQENPFAFEATIAYLYKWGIIYRWLTYDRKAAGARFNKMILEVTSGQEQLFAHS